MTGLEDLRKRFRAFVDEEVVPAEPTPGTTPHGPDEALVEQLRAAARRAGVFAPTVPKALGGLGLSHREQAVALEEAGRSLLGPAATLCAAPDEGNVVLLQRIASPGQRERYLEPLARGEVRSAFAMTEQSPGAGSDPSQLATGAERVSGGWVIDGHKWFISGADGAAFFIVMARTEPGATMFIVAADNPGLRVGRRIGALDTVFAGGHCEVFFDGCRVGDDAVLGAVGEGFAYAQLRLAPARLTHCMRWLGAARRAHETAVRYAADRPMWGAMLADLGMAQQMIADNEIDIASSRALIRDAAEVLDSGAPGRHETSIAKVFVAEAVFRVVDRCVQLCGALGVSDDAVVSQLYREVRPFRVYDGPSEVHRQSIARRVVARARAGTPPGGP